MENRGDEIYLNDVAVATGYNVLLALGHAHQAVLGDDTRQFAHHGHVFRHCSRQLLELRVVLYERLQQAIRVS